MPGALHAATRRLRYAVVGRARIAAHRPYEMLKENFERLLGRDDPLVPPARLIFVGGGRRDFRALGDKWLQTMIRIAEVQPQERILDVGCGIGRMAVAFTGYLSPEGRYDGFDVVPKGITWCQQAITPRFPNFRFQLANLYNKEYNPAATVRASEYAFPYDDNAFDFVFLTSVFTHMLPEDVRRYLAEVRRVLRPRGRCLITWFVLDAEARQRVEAGATGPLRDFRNRVGDCWVVDTATPEAAVAYDDVMVRSVYAEAGLTIREPLLFGSWSGRTRISNEHGQDIVLAHR
jgi:SAM-dependent methyltransferase